MYVFRPPPYTYLGEGATADRDKADVADNLLRRALLYVLDREVHLRREVTIKSEISMAWDGMGWHGMTWDDTG